MKDDGNRRETQTNQRRVSRNKGGKADKDRKWHIIYKIKQKITNRDNNVSFKRSSGCKKWLDRQIWQEKFETSPQKYDLKLFLVRLLSENVSGLQIICSCRTIPPEKSTRNTFLCDRELPVTLMYLQWNKPFTKMSDLSLRRRLDFRAQTWWMNTTLTLH